MKPHVPYVLYVPDPGLQRETIPSFLDCRVAHSLPISRERRAWLGRRISPRTAITDDDRWQVVASKAAGNQQNLSTGQLLN